MFLYLSPAQVGNEDINLNIFILLPHQLPLSQAYKRHKIKFLTE